jgi:hypothetical protein
VPGPEDGWFIAAMGGFVLLTARWFGRELSQKLAEPGEGPERTAAYYRWHVFVCRIIGTAILGYGGWLMFLSKG